jgi:SAM-dependent methyltransferase
MNVPPPSLAPMPGEEPAEEFGDWYDAKQGDTGDPWHRTLIDPGLLAALGELPLGARLLDLGCGNGYLARRWARAGASVVGVDRSRSLIARCRAREAREPLGVRFEERDAAHLDGFPEAHFDLAVANMSLMDIEDAAGAIAEVGRVVRDHGRFVFSISHPCFDVDSRSGYVVEPDPRGETPLVFRKVTGYRTPHADRYEWELDGGRRVTTTGYHRPLSWYARTLRAAGFAIVDLLEPSPGPEFVGRRIAKEWIEAIPLHLVVDARREPRAGGAMGARSPP